MTANDLVFSPQVRGKAVPYSESRPMRSKPSQANGARVSFLILSPSSLSMAIQVLRSPYGQLSEAAPSRLEATQGSEAQVAAKGPRPSNGVDLVLRLRGAARRQGAPRAPGLLAHLQPPPRPDPATRRATPTGG